MKFDFMEKIARICWNTNDWKYPSGIEGKSKNKHSYEKIMGYGHEEWLLDDTRIMPDGYHYGFLQAMNVKSDIHEHVHYDIHLFTITPTSQKVYIGCLCNAEGITLEQSQAVYDYYKKKGWITEMKQEVMACGGYVRDFDPEWMFNIRFRFKDAKINYSNPLLIESNSIGHRYNLMNKKTPFAFIKHNNDTEYLNVDAILRKTKENEITINPIHKKIQNAVVKLLSSQYTNLSLETGDFILGQRVDIQGKQKNTNEWHYFEIKTYSAKRSIREALGQILEYAHYPSSHRADRLYIIGPEKPDEMDIAYLKMLRKTYNLPVWFRWYSFEDNKLYDPA